MPPMDDPVTKKNLRPATNFVMELRNLVIATESEAIDFAHLLIAERVMESELPIEASASAQLELALVHLEAYKNCLMQMQEDLTGRD